jgi:hypothetical protein
MDVVKGEKKSLGKNFVGGLIEGINFPKGRSTPLIDLIECNDIILVDRHYFLQNKRLIEAWALQA